MEDLLQENKTAVVIFTRVIRYGAAERPPSPCARLMLLDVDQRCSRKQLRCATAFVR